MIVDSQNTVKPINVDILKSCDHYFNHGMYRVGQICFLKYSIFIWYLNSVDYSV